MNTHVQLSMRLETRGLVDKVCLLAFVQNQQSTLGLEVLKLMPHFSIQWKCVTTRIQFYFPGTV